MLISASLPIAPVPGLSTLAPRYRALLCDVWGVIHDGETARKSAVDALVRFRAEGGRVVLITNAPRPNIYVARQLEDLAVPRAAWDDIVTSGDCVRDLLTARAPLKVLHVGRDTHLPLYDDLDVELVDEAACDLVSCTGLYDEDGETPEDYAGRLAAWRARNLPLLCANPDVRVQRGERLIWCAGALALAYEERGGETEVIGKPHPLIYDRAFAALERLAGPVDPGEVLAVGDGVRTDIRGAAARGIDALYVTAGVDTARFGPRDAPAADLVSAFLAEAELPAIGFQAHLSW